MADEKKPEKEKEAPKPLTYTLSKEEMDFLRPRYALAQEHQLVANDLVFVIQQFFAQNVLPRLSIDTQKQNVAYDIPNGTLQVTNKIIVPAEPVVSSPKAAK